VTQSTASVVALEGLGKNGRWWYPGLGGGELFGLQLTHEARESLLEDLPLYGAASLQGPERPFQVRRPGDLAGEGIGGDAGLGGGSGQVDGGLVAQRGRQDRGPRPPCQRLLPRALSG